MYDPEPLWLTNDELRGVTGKRRRTHQAAWLRENGFQFKERADGSILVSRRHFEYVMGGILDRMFIGFPEPDFETLN
jgi:hypothetical protein